MFYRLLAGDLTLAFINALDAVQTKGYKVLVGPDRSAQSQLVSAVGAGTPHNNYFEPIVHFRVGFTAPPKALLLHLSKSLTLSPFYSLRRPSGFLLLKLAYPELQN